MAFDSSRRRKSLPRGSDCLSFTITIRTSAGRIHLFRYCALKNIFMCFAHVYARRVMTAARFLFKLLSPSCFRWSIGQCNGCCTLVVQRRRASKPSIARRYCLIDTPAVFQRAYASAGRHRFIKKEHHERERQERVGNFDPWVR